MTPPVLRTSGLTVTMPRAATTFVRDLSIEIDNGQIVGLVGESGCGKTMTALSLAGLLDPRVFEVTGQVEIDGHRADLGSERDMSRFRGSQVAMVFQEPMTALDPLFRIGDQIAETVRAHGRCSRRAARDRAVQLLADVGIPDPRSKADAYPHQLSGGMRQRVVIAIALSANARLLVADEPTTALDVTIQDQIVRLLARLTEQHDTGVLFITHDLALVAEVCDSVYTMYGGQIVEHRPTDPLLTAPAHPYTRALLACIPRIENRRSHLPTIGGRVPAPADYDAGCTFRGRCPSAEPRCAAPQQLVDDPIGSVRCWKASELAGYGDGGAR